MNNIHIEKLAEADLSKYRELLGECFGAASMPETYSGLYDSNNNYDIIVAKDGDELVGAMTLVRVDLFSFKDLPFLMLFDVCVSAHRRKAGVATKIMKYIRDYAVKNGYHSISLTCRNSAHDAHSFYERMGFDKVDSRKYSMFF